MRTRALYSTLERKYHQIQKELLAGVSNLGGVILISTLWCWLVEGWRLVDAAYMTVITLASVEFLGVQPLGDRGRLFTISLILMGVVSIGYIVNRFTEALIQGYFQEGLRLRQQKRWNLNCWTHWRCRT